MYASTVTGAEMRSWPQDSSCITLFAKDLEVAKQLYHTTFWVPILFEDNDAVMFKVGTISIKLLQTTAADKLYAPATVAPSAAGSRFVLTMPVDDVDVRCAELTARGVELLNGQPIGYGA